MNHSPILEIEDITCTLPGTEQTIVDKLSLTLDSGDFLIILGGNGSGKSSLIKAINGQYHLSHGHVRLKQETLSDLSVENISKHVVTLTQDLYLSTFPDLTVWENCQLAALRRHQGKECAIKSIEKESFSPYLQEYHPSLPSKLNEYVRNLSGGERQSLALAFCLLYPPGILLLDEHTSALDPKTAKQIMKKTDEQVKNFHTTTMMTTHDLDVALSFGNRLIVMKAGKIIFQASEQDKKALTKKQILQFY